MGANYKSSWRPCKGTSFTFPKAPALVTLDALLAGVLTAKAAANQYLVHTASAFVHQLLAHYQLAPLS